MVCLTALTTWWFFSKKPAATEPFNVPDKGINEINYEKQKPDEPAPQTEQSEPKQQTTPTSNDKINVVITAFNQNGATLQVRVLISELLQSGDCTLRVSDTSIKIEKTADIFATSSSSTCKGFDIDTSGLAKGTYTLSLDVKSGSRSGSVSREVTIP